MLASIGLSLLCLGGAAQAQQPLPPLPPPGPAPWQVTPPDLSGRRPLPATNQAPIRVLTFHKPAEGTRETALQQTQGSLGRLPNQGPDVSEYTTQLEPPSFDRLIRLESEDAFRERLRQETRDRGTAERATFPEDRQLADERYKPRTFPKQVLRAEPAYVCYNRTFFEEKNAERYGWDFGLIQPLLSTGYFLKDFALFPYHFFSEPCRWCESDAGECLPGDPVPYLIRPPGLSSKGALAEAGAILGLVAIFP